MGLFNLSSKRSIILEVTYINDNKLAFNQSIINIASITKKILLELHCCRYMPQTLIRDQMHEYDIFFLMVNLMGVRSLHSFPLIEEWASFSVICVVLFISVSSLFANVFL